MPIKLKDYRVRANLTQSELAKRIGVSQPSYQRWESGSSPIPDKKISELCKILSVSSDTLMGRHPPINSHLYNDSVADDLSYYGEISIHFRGPGDPLLLSISEASFSKAYSDIQSDGKFVVVRSFSNQTVAIRKSAIADLYFCSEAFDYFGPEHRIYKYIDLHLPDNRDWEIVEALGSDFDLDDFDLSHVERVKNAIMVTDDQYEKLVAEGRIPADQLEMEKEKNEKITQDIFMLALNAKYQLSTGVIRTLPAYDKDAVYNSMCEIIDLNGEDTLDNMIIFPAEGGHQTAFIAHDALDYISIPTHKYEAGSIEAASDFLETMEFSSLTPTRSSPGASTSRRRPRGSPPSPR